MSHRHQLIVVDFHRPSRELCSQTAVGLEFEIAFATDRRQALATLERDKGGVVLIDAATIADYLELTALIKKHSARNEVVIGDERATIPKAVAAIKGGASDYLEKPYRPAELELALSTSIERYERFQGLALPLQDLERRAIEDALAQAGGNKLEAARLLSIGKTTLYRKLREYSGRGLREVRNPRAS